MTSVDEVVVYFVLLRWCFLRKWGMVFVRCVDPGSDEFLVLFSHSPCSRLPIKNRKQVGKVWMRPMGRLHLAALSKRGRGAWHFGRCWSF